jgi:hypothetical protein
MRRASATSLTRWVVSRSHSAGSSPSGGLISHPTTRLTAIVLGKPSEALAVDGPHDLDRAEFDGKLGLSRLSSRRGGQLDRHPSGLVQGVGFGEKRHSVGQTAVLRRPHQLFHIGRPTRETFVDVAFAIFDHRNAGRAGFGQGAGAFGAAKPAPTVLLLKRPLPALFFFAALARQKNIIDKAKHRLVVGVDRKDRMKGPRPFSSTRKAEVS